MRNTCNPYIENPFGKIEREREGGRRERGKRKRNDKSRKGEERKRKEKQKGLPKQKTLIWCPFRNKEYDAGDNPQH